MSDLYELQLAWELGDAVPEEVLDDLRWHLGLQDVGSSDGDGSECEPLLAGRGPASRIGGVLFGALARGPRGWSVTVRQEVHAEELSELDQLLSRLAAHTAIVNGPVGQLRFYEDDAPDLLVAEAGAIARQPLRSAGSELVPFLAGLA
ncbi:hypothetical protein [Streptomyces sp. NPDC037389]|uniref:hypothetical protein n=1 Tax=Streptomyces sp. NPDC037389 TaxID=3155369 RepID=UPI0033ED1791